MGLSALFLLVTMFFWGTALRASVIASEHVDTGDFVLGVGLSIAGAMGWAVGVLLTKTAFIRKPDIHMVGLTMGQYVIGGGAALALAFLLEGARPPSGAPRTSGVPSRGSRSAARSSRPSRTSGRSSVCPRPL